MRRPPSRGVLGATFLALAALGAGAAINAGSSRAGSPGVIVFASDREKDNPGEIYSLAPGNAPRDISRSLAAEHGLAVAPVGDQIAFWSNRSGADQVYLARSDGSHVRLVRGLGDTVAPGSSRDGGTLVFSSDGSSIVAVLYTGGTQADFVIDARRATARPIRRCSGVLQPSPDGTLIACSAPGTTSVYDLAGRLHFKLPGSNATWSASGWMTASPAAGATKPGVSGVIVDESGRTVGRVTGSPITWSPDGRLLLFARGRSLLVADRRDTSHARVLVRNWAPGAASFTPDGRYVSAADRVGRLMLLPVAGGPPIRGFAFASGVWTRDGRVAYVGRPSSGRPGVTIPVFVAGRRGQHPQLVGRFPFDDHGASDLRWLPGGRRLLFLTANTCNGSDLFAVPAAGGATLRLTHDLRDVGSPAWSHDGTTITYVARNFACHLGDGQPTHLETVLADGSGARRVTDDGDLNQGSFDSAPAFSPDGSRIAFEHATMSDSSLETVAASGGPRTTVLPPKGAATAPAWSPDGSRIAYVAAGASLMVIASSGGAPQLIAALPARKFCNSGGLAWSPDGTQIAAPEDGGIDLITLGPAASARLAISVPCAEYPSFSPDGSQIAFDAPSGNALGGQTAIMVANTDGSGLRRLSTVPFRQSVHPTWQPAS